MANKFRFKEFFLFLSSIRGDIANVTAPPFFLAPQSFIESLKCFTQRPSLFSAPAMEPDPEIRAALVVKWWLASLKSAFYVGSDPAAGIRKPLNPFLGELWFGEWHDDVATTKIISEQVSHHPPITACYMYDDVHGIRGEGYTRVEMTFSGYINVRQTGHAVVHIDKEEEDHLIPLPNIAVRGFLGGRLYPEITGVYHVVSSSGFTTEVRFIGRGLVSGVRNSFTATLYRSDDGQRIPIYTFQGCWNDRFEIRHVATDYTELHVVDGVDASPTKTADVSSQDTWESRRAWAAVYEALDKGDYQATLVEKSKLEQAQREMRKQEKIRNESWCPKFFKQVQGDYFQFHRLASKVNVELASERTKGVWKFDRAEAKRAEAPFHGNLTPFGQPDKL